VSSAIPAALAVSTVMRVPPIVDCSMPGAS